MGLGVGRTRCVVGEESGAGGLTRGCSSHILELGHSSRAAGS